MMPKLPEKKRLRARYYVNDNETECVKIFTWVCERMIELGIMWGISGKVCVKNEDNEYVEMKMNHMKCIIRRDYIEKFGQHPALHAIIDDVIMFNQERFIGVKPEDCEQLHVVGWLNS